MKLLNLKIKSKQGFRSLPKDFEIKFHTLSESENMEYFRPFCFAGLNGSGKSNVLEALSTIFYHLEFCVARYKPDSFEKHFQREKCSPDAFTLEYLIGQHNRKEYTLAFFDKVIIEKEEGKAPQMIIKAYPFDNSVEERKVSLTPSQNRQEAAEGKQYLPRHIVGYSSGENEILSLPFIKSRLVHLDEYKQATEDNYNNYDEPENSLIYIDNNMSQAVLMTCLLFETEETLAPIRDVENTGIVGLRSFRMNINLHDFSFYNKDTGRRHSVPILKLIAQNQIEKLKQCATSWFTDTKILWLDFYVDDATKAAFKHYFNDNAFEVFQLFRLLYELNDHFIDEKIVEEVYQSKGLYTDGKLPLGSPDQDVFHFLDFYIIKKLKGTDKDKDLLLRNFSDGEHQFLHTMGICLLLKDRKALLLLDEPETHFNPSWRAKFVKILNDSIEASNKTEHSNGNFNIHLLKDVLLTSHSPFIISDCLPDNVLLFERNKKGVLTAKKASELGLDTYGTSINLLSHRIFKTKETIGKYVFSRLNEFREKFENNGDKNELIDQINEEFGDSIEKLLLIKEYSDIDDSNA